MDLTIIIVSFKSGEILDRCLSSIDAKYPVIVVENSQDQTLKLNLEKKYTNVKCFMTDENLGYGKANNLGIEKAKTKNVLILNPDTELKNNTIEELEKFSSKNPDYAIIAPTIYNHINKGNNNLDTNNSPYEVQEVKGFAVMINKAVITKIGLFDENFFLYFEEIDLCRRVIKDKKKIYVVPSALVLHYGGKSHDKAFDMQMELSRNWHYMWSKYYFYKKHFGILLSIFKIFPNFISSVIKFVLFSVLNKKDLKKIYFCRMNGIYNSIIGRKAWYRPQISQ